MAEVFFTGNPCRNGHVDRRYVSTGLCLTCVRERFERNGWVQKNKERRKQHCKKYRDANRGKTITASLASIAKKPDVPKAWVKANREKVREVKRAWKERNPEFVRLVAHRRRTRMIGKISRDIVPRLMKAQRGRCANCCRLMKDKFEIDHIVPLALNGAHADDNLQLLCVDCNRRKSAKDPIRWAQEQGRLL